MALTALDSNTALVVIDLQKGLAGSAFAQPDVVARARSLIDGGFPRLGETGVVSYILTPLKRRG